ncbi:MAG: ATP-grasp domain-containing protein [Limnochordia bacterium]
MQTNLNHDDALNILILSCGTRNKIVQYFRRELDGRGMVIAADCSELAPALYDAHRYFIVPHVNSHNYIETILEICKKNRIKAVLSLIDPELSILAKHRERFVEIGVLPVLSDYDVVELCLDKYRMAEFLQECGFLSAKSYISKEAFLSDVADGGISYPVFVKPVKGSASLHVSKAACREELEFLLGRCDDPMIQEFLAGTELGADVYIDLISGEPVSIFVKEKIQMRAGETDKSISIKDEKLFGLIADFVKKAGLKGIVDIDIFRDNGNYYISEVNPRFGGGYPHAHECGVNMVEMIIRNVQGLENKAVIGDYESGVHMMKFSEVFLKSD